MNVKKFLSIAALTMYSLASLAQEPTMIRKIVNSGDEICVSTVISSVFFSPDKGNNWKKTSAGFPGGTVIYGTAKSGNTWFAATSAGVFAYDGASGSWVKKNEGLPSSYILYIGANENKIFVTASKSIYCSADKGNSWQEVTGVSGEYLWVNGNQVFLATSERKFFRSDDNGATWNPFGKNPFPGTSSIFEIYMKGNDLYIGTGKGSFVADVRDELWTPVNDQSDSYVRSFSVTDTLMVGGKYLGVNISKDKGNSWTLSTNGLPPKPDISALLIINKKIFAGTKEGLYVSTDKGVSWEPADPLFNAKTYEKFSNTVSVTKGPAVDYYNQALAELNYGNNAQAMEKINKAIELNPDYADALSYRGYFHHLNKNYDKAIADYLAADKLKHNINGYFIASSYAKAGNKAEALKWLETALATTENKAQLNAVMSDPDLEVLHSEPKWQEITAKDWYTPYEKIINEAYTKTGKKDLMGALEEWNKAIALDPAKDEAYGQRAINYLYQGDMEKALADATKAIQLNGNKSVYYGNRAYIYKEQKKYAEALADYNKAIAIDPQNIVYADRAMVRFALSQSDPGVAADLKTYLAINYKDDFNYFLLGTYYYGINNMQEAVNNISKAIQLKSDEPNYYKKRAQAYFAQKNLQSSIDDCNSAITLNSSDGEAYYLRGVVKGEQLMKNEACSDWKKAKELGYYDENGYYNSICK